MARSRTALGAVVVTFLLLLGLRTSHTAVAQTDPYSGLPAEVRVVAEAVRAGNLQRILAVLPTNATTVVRTAYPGSGGNVSLETARQEITALVVSDPSRSDSFGNGAYTLLAVWRPSIDPRETLLIGSGIGLDGARVSTGFGVSVTGGRASVTGYGWILDLSATLAQWGGQGDLRLISPTTPFPPATGSGPASQRESSVARGSIWVGLLLAGVTTAAAFGFRGSRRLTRQLSNVDDFAGGYQRKMASPVVSGAGFVASAILVTAWALMLVPLLLAALVRLLVRRVRSRA